MRFVRNLTREEEEENEFPDILLPPRLECDRGTEDGAQSICPFVAGTKIQQHSQIKINIYRVCFSRNNEHTI